MKKIIVTVTAVLAFGFTNAQKAKFGVTAGVDFATAKTTFLGASATQSETGFYIGGLVDIQASEKFHIQPEVVLVFVQDSKQLQIPLLGKYYVVEKFSVLAGPDILIDLDKSTGLTKTVGFGADFGAAYDFTENISLEAKYNLGITNLIKDAPSGVSGKISGLFIGGIYKF